MWDPTGVGGPDDGWPANEDDAYLLKAAGQIWNGQSADDAADYLVQSETEHMSWTQPLAFVLAI